MSLSCTTPSTRAPSATTSGVPPCLAMSSTMARTLRGNVPPMLLRRSARSRRPRLCGSAARSRSTPLMRVCAVNGTNVAPSACMSRPRRPILLLGEHDDAAPLRRLVGERGELRGVGELALVHAGRREERGRLAVAERDRAGLVEQAARRRRPPPRRRGPTWRSRWPGSCGPCRRCRWPRAARRSWSGSGRPAAPPARSS